MAASMVMHVRYLRYSDHIYSFYPIQSYTMLCYAMLSYAMLCYAMICYAMLCYAMLCYAIFSYPILSYPILLYLILSYAILCYPILCCPIFSFATRLMPPKLSFHICNNSLTCHHLREFEEVPPGLAVMCYPFAFAFDYQSIFQDEIQSHHLIDNQSITNEKLCSEMRENKKICRRGEATWIIKRRNYWSRKWKAKFTII